MHVLARDICPFIINVFVMNLDKTQFVDGVIDVKIQNILYIFYYTQYRLIDCYMDFLNMNFLLFNFHQTRTYFQNKKFMND